MKRFITMLVDNRNFGGNVSEADYFNVKLNVIQDNKILLCISLFYHIKYGAGV